MIMTLQFSQACENNKVVILEVLQQYFVDVDCVLEIGSGTGQHAVYFSENLTHLLWQPTDQEEYIAGLLCRIEQEGGKNLLSPLKLNVNGVWPVTEVSGIFSANTLHIMSWLEVGKLFSTLKNILLSQGIFCLYGPFNYNNNYVSESNRKFDGLLKARDPRSGIRDFEAILQLSEKANLDLLEDHTMPANNRLLVFKKR
ncbi:MAG: hypothetical protein ACI89U_002495 [Gammaproteobacteria bacterium]